MTTFDARLGLLACCLLTLGGCALQRAAAPAPAVPSEYASLPDTFVCVVDRAAADGLREVPAKLRGNTIVLLVDGQIRPLDDVHPIDLIAGYAGDEDWLRRGEPVSFGGRTFARTGGERLIERDLLRRAGEFRGIILFSGREDATDPNALYVPTAPGCVFQAFVRDDLIRR